MSNTNEPRALTAALSSPAFVTQGAGLAMHVANRHVSRWAPEVGEPGANRIKPLRNLGFVDRLVSPWIESAQRSASLRMFSQYIATGAPERPSAPSVSWVFPRPWYQDELDWMAAARTVGSQAAVEQVAPQMFTTRGTYVAPAQQVRESQLALPSALYEYVAPSLSIARPDQAASVSDAYSPLVPLAATGAAQVISRAMAPLLTQSATTTASPTAAAARMSPGLRAVLTTMLERSAQTQVATEPSRISSYAPEMVTPPAPRPDAPVPTAAQAYQTSQAEQVAEQYAEQRARIAELQRIAQREHAARVEAARASQPAAPTADPGRVDEVRAAEARAIEQRQVELQQRAGDAAAQRGAADLARREADRVAADAERTRLEERIAQRLAERRAQEDAQRLHAAARDAAARDARNAPAQPVTVSAPMPVETRASELAAAVASLPPELATMVAGSIGNRPDRAVQAIAELSEALRTVELIARNSAAGGSIESTRGPRLVMPAGLGGLVATVERSAPQMMPVMPMTPMAPMAAPAAVRSAPRVPAMPFLAAQQATTSLAPTSALGAAAARAPAALSHVAWSDRWLARFAGAKPQSLDLLTATNAAPEMRLELLAAAAPNAVFVAPFFDDDRRPSVAADVMPAPRGAQAAQTVARFDDDAETPDDVFSAVMRARTSAAQQAAAVAAAASQPPAQPSFERETLADLVAHAAPSAPNAGLAAGLASSPFAPALRHVLPMGAAPTFDVRALFGGGLGATYLAGLLAASTDEIATSPALPTWASWAQSAGAMTAVQPMGDELVREVAGFEPTYVAPEQPRAVAGEGEVEVAQAAALAEPLTTIRSALLSWDVETFAHQPQAGMPAETRVSAPTLASSMIDSMTLPMLAETAALRDLGSVDVGGMTAHMPSYAAPGMIADRAQAWSVAQERSTSDLAFDFVTPELVLAARVYGLGPAEAAQAARLAIAGPGQLTAMAGQVDRTFVQALAIEGERRSGERSGRAVTSAFPLASGETAAVTSRTDEGAGAATASSSLFGVERRAPRGAFLWPSATTAALGLNAAAPDGELSMSVAALELLAAQAVAELGTYAALGERGVSLGGLGDATAMSTQREVLAPGAEPPETDVLASAEAMVPMARREKFQALYVALGQSASGKSWSPAARAARALALAGRGDESITARERATIAWDVLPMVYGVGNESETLSTGDAATRMERRREELRALDPVFVDSRPGLGLLSARAGEALGSYVAPSGGSMTQSGSGASGSSSSREVGAVLRAPTAAQELVQTGRPAGRHGGGEVEIPPWFEAAAKKMLEDRSQVSEGISLAELTLVQTAAPQQIAADSRVAGGTQPVAPAPAATAGAEKDKIDIDKLANDVYREILVLMDIARERNGEPYL